GNEKAWYNDEPHTHGRRSLCVEDRQFNFRRLLYAAGARCCHLFHLLLKFFGVHSVIMQVLLFSCIYFPIITICLSFSRPLDKRDLIVPSGFPRISPISRMFLVSK